jgi:hypothetical protein
MTPAPPFFGAADIHAALGFPLLVEALRTAFSQGATVPLRHVHTVRGAPIPR